MPEIAQTARGNDTTDSGGFGNIDIAAEQAAAASTTKEAGTPAAETIVETVVPESTSVDKKDDSYVAPVEKTMDDGEEDLMEKFNAQKNRANVPVVEKKKEEKKVEAAPVAAKVEKVIVGATDHADVPEELRPLFKQMSNAAIEKLKPLVLESFKAKERETALTQQLEAAKKGTLPDNYLEHEMSYVLTPEFAAKSQRVELASSVYNHWRQQLANLRAGADTYTPLVNDAQGNIVEGQAQKVDRDTITQIEDIRTSAQQQYLDEKNGLNSIKAVHQNKVNQSKQWINDFQTKAFPAFENNEKFKPLVADTLRQFPAAFQTSPLAPALAKAIITITELGALLKKGKEGAATTTPAAKVATAANGNPSAAAIAGAGEVKAKSLVDEDDLMGAFTRAKKGLPI